MADDEERRDLFLSACAAKASKMKILNDMPGRHGRLLNATRGILTLAGKPINRAAADMVINELEAEIAAARVAWKNVADLMQTLARLDAAIKKRKSGAVRVSRRQKTLIRRLEGGCKSSTSGS